MVVAESCDKNCSVASVKLSALNPAWLHMLNRRCWFMQKYGYRLVVAAWYGKTGASQPLMNRAYINLQNRSCWTVHNYKSWFEGAESRAALVDASYFLHGGIETTALQPLDCAQTCMKKCSVGTVHELPSLGCWIVQHTCCIMPGERCTIMIVDW
jgi:hypothetical protein